MGEALEKERSGQEAGLQTQENKQVNASERFMTKVMSEFSSNVAGELQITDYQRQLIQGYFIGISRSLDIAEEARLRKNRSNSDRKYDNNLAVTWANVNLQELAVDLVHYARMGLDMMQENHLSPIPYKNNKTSKYDITLMPGYNGIQYIAERYAVETPVAVTIELVYSTDKFIPIKKSRENQVESYEFEITNAFNRGEIIGGFGYIQYTDPQKNKLIIMSRADIEKRKPRYAAAEFWGGKKTEYVNGKPTEVQLEGWIDQMFLKTLKREVYSAKYMPRDPKKVDDNYQYMRMREARYAEIEAQAEIAEHANTITIDTTMEDTQPETEQEARPEQGPSQQLPPLTAPDSPVEATAAAPRSTSRRRSSNEQPPTKGPEF